MTKQEIHNLDLLKQMAKIYIWWKTPDEAIKYPNRIIAQVMDIGDWYDVEKLLQAFGKERFKEILQSAEVGQFSPKSWNFWHLQLKLSVYGVTPVPDLPVRRFENNLIN